MRAVAEPTGAGLPDPDLARRQAFKVLGLDEPRGNRHDLAVFDDHLREGKPHAPDGEVTAEAHHFFRLGGDGLNRQTAGGFADDGEGGDGGEVFHNYQHNDRGMGNVQRKVKLF